MEGSFSQPNAGVCQHMMEWAHAATRGSQAGDLLELYCGAQLPRTLSLTPRLVKGVEVDLVFIMATLHANCVCLSICLSN